MDCNKIEEQYLIAYLFDEAGEEERRKVEEHLESCSKCNATLSELRGTVTTMHRWKDEDIPHRVVLMQESSAPGRRRLIAPLWLKGLGWAAAAAVLVLVVSQGSIQYGNGNLTVSFRAAKNHNLRKDWRGAGPR
jgi:anti-sigma factor RsiW